MPKTAMPSAIALVMARPTSARSPDPGDKRCDSPPATPTARLQHRPAGDDEPDGAEQRRQAEHGAHDGGTGVGHGQALTGCSNRTGDAAVAQPEEAEENQYVGEAQSIESTTKVPGDHG